MPNPVAAGAVVAVGAGMLLRKLRGKEEDEGSEDSLDSSSEDSFSVPSTYDTSEEPEDDGNSESAEHSSNQDRYSGDVDESYIAHEQAGQRDAPVELGEVYEIFIDDETRHHSGRRDLTGKFEGFRIFVKDPPKHVRVDDIVNVKITSFNRGGTSADAKIVGE